MPQVTFTKNGEILKTLDMKAGSRLWNAKEQGIQFVEEPNCEGQGRCKKCKCNIDGHEKLSCMEKVWKEDLIVEVMTYYKNT